MMHAFTAGGHKILHPCSMDKPVINVGIVSDVVCPWCYIGTRRLQQAMALESHKYDFEVEYFPFELNPHTPEEGIDNRQYLCKKFGGESRFEQLIAHIKDLATNEGLNFNLEKQPTYPNTRNAHRIILMARESNDQERVVDAMFRAYFADGVDLSKTENLIEIAANVGLDRERVELLMQSNTGKTQIEMAEKELQDLGINSVPLFIINNEKSISGAQPVDAFRRAFEEVALVTGDLQRYANR